jgi:hypothetical protein
MEYVTPRNVSNGSTAGNSVFYAVCADIDVTQQYRDCWKRCSPWVRAEAISGESNRAKSVASRVDFELGGRQKENGTVAPGGGVEGLTVVSRCVAKPSQFVRWSPTCEDVSPEAEERPLLEDVTRQRNEKTAV